MKSAKVLVVDDEPEIGRLFRDALQRKGHQAIITETGQEALVKAAKERFDMVFLDIVMPGLNGIATLKLLKKQNPDILVVMISGHASEEMVTETLDGGAFVCLLKPFSVMQILDTVRLFSGLGGEQA